MKNISVIAALVFMLGTGLALLTTLNKSQPLNHGNGMSEGMTASMNVATDREFIERMIPHHQEAVDTAREVLARGGDVPAIKALAEQIINGQEREIADMKSWYQNWYGVPYKDSGTYMAMMRPLAPYSGEALDRIFAEDMSLHHHGAVMMAHMALGFNGREEVKSLSRRIIESQNKEIALMQAVLNGAPSQEISVALANGALEPNTITINDGDVVTMHVTPSEGGEFHLTGYELEYEMVVDELFSFAFLANQAGRYAIEFHPEDGHDEVEIGSLIVNPK